MSRSSRAWSRGSSRARSSGLARAWWSGRAATGPTVALLLAATACVAGCGQPEPVAVTGPGVGALGPDFRLTDSRDESVGFADFRGRWVVLYFFPPGDMPACACEASSFTQLLVEMCELDAAVLAVTSAKPAATRDMARRYSLGLPLASRSTGETHQARLLSDTDLAVAELYGTRERRSLLPDRVRRATFLIGPDGRVRDCWPAPAGPEHAVRVAERIEELRAAE